MEALEVDQGRRRPDARRRAGRESQLIEAALDCIATLGLRDTTVQDLAQRADMAAGSISQYFRSKEALFTAALRQLAQEFEATWREALARADESPAARLAAFVDVYFEAPLCQRRKVAVWFAFWGEVRARPQYREVCEGFDRAHDAAIVDLVQAMLRHEGRGVEAAPALARLVSATCHGLWLDLLTASDRPAREDLRALAHRQLAALFPQYAYWLDNPPATAHGRT